MSTITAVGPATTLDGPIPVPPPRSLVETLRQLEEDVWGDLLIEVSDDERRRWLNGVGLWGYPSHLPLAWEVCTSGTFATKSDASTMPQATFEPFGIYLPVACSSLGLTDDFTRRAELALEASQSFRIARTLASRLGTSPNPFFGSAAMTLPGGTTARSPSLGLRYLEDAIGDTGRAGFIHITPPVAAALQPIPLGEGEGPLTTPAGNVIVVDGGYADLDPEGAAPAPGATQVWAYATGPVQIHLSEIELIPDDLMSALEVATNRVVYRAERYALATWDTALSAGVLIDWSL